MTILFGNAKYSFQDELSSRLERSGVEGSAVRPSDFPNSGAKLQDSHTDSFLPLLKQGAAAETDVQKSALQDLDPEGLTDRYISVWLKL
jgi:hypothetical protein